MPGELPSAKRRKFTPIEPDERTVAAAKEAYWKNGFAVVRLMTSEHAQHLEQLVSNMIESTPESEKVVTDEAASLGLQPPRSALLKLHEVTALLDSPVLKAVLRAILGGDDLVLETTRLLAVEPGQSYRQGWHRDVPPGHVVPVEVVKKVLEGNADGKWHHNVVQVTIAMARDECYWCVPGSHARLYTAEELVHFDQVDTNAPEREDSTGCPYYQSGKGAGIMRLPLNGSNATRPGAELPGGTLIKLEPGEMVLQHNLMIHRGWAGTSSGPDAGVAKMPRRALQCAFHSAHRPTTWHFRRVITDDYEAMGPDREAIVGEKMAAILDRRRRRMLEPLFTQSAPEEGDEGWRKANMDVFFSGGFQPDHPERA